MNTSMAYSEDETDLRRSLRAALADRCTTAQVIASYDGDRTAADAVRTVIAELGLTGLLVAVEFGGAGGTVRDAAVVLEELGRAAAPSAYLPGSVVAATILGALGDADGLERIATGEQVVLANPAGAPSVADGVTVDASGRLTGRVRTVLGAVGAGTLLVPVVGERVRLHAVAVDSPGATVTAVAALDMTRLIGDVDLAGATGRVVSDDAGPAIAHGLMTGAALAASDLLGSATWCLETVVEHLLQRHQFGRPLGSFQALKHRVADMWLETEMMRTAARQAVIGLAGDEPEIAVAIAQSYASETAVHIAEEALQLHGGIGMTWEHPVHLHLKRAKAGQVVFGSGGEHRRALAALVDLPAPR